ncbi:unnamed protein product, partial [Polarella glacialis]
MLTGQISSGASWPRKLAEEVCKLYQVPVALPTSSGASALHVALLACNLGPQDHVLVPSLTMVAVANMVKMVGSKPVYCDCAPGSVNPGKEQFVEKATPRTKAVIVCHTYGVPCKDIVAIAELCKERGWWLIEDICEAMGTRADNGELVGTFGDFAVSSLYANKQITAGDGGWVHSKEKRHHDRLKSLINHGFDPAYHFLHFETAPNAKMNGLGAAFVCAQVKTLPTLMEHRAHVASWYREGLAGIAGLGCIEQRQIDAPWVFGIETKDRKTRDSLRDHMAICGIETRNYFYPLHLEPVNFYGDDVGVYDVVLQHCEQLAQVGFYLPTHSFLERSDVMYICSCVRRFYEPSQAAEAPPRERGWADVERWELSFFQLRGRFRAAKFQPSGPRCLQLATDRAIASMRFQAAGSGVVSLVRLVHVRLVQEFHQVCIPRAPPSAVTAAALGTRAEEEDPGPRMMSSSMVGSRGLYAVEEKERLLLASLGLRRAPPPGIPAGRASGFGPGLGASSSQQARTPLGLRDDRYSNLGARAGCLLPSPAPLPTLPHGHGGSHASSGSRSVPPGSRTRPITPSGPGAAQYHPSRRGSGDEPGVPSARLLGSALPPSPFDNGPTPVLPGGRGIE